LIDGFFTNEDAVRGPENRKSNKEGATPYIPTGVSYHNISLRLREELDYSGSASGAKQSLRQCYWLPVAPVSG
jgi:hypothetical protein